LSRPTAWVAVTEVLLSQTMRTERAGARNGIVAEVSVRDTSPIVDRCPIARDMRRDKRRRCQFDNGLVRRMGHLSNPGEALSGSVAAVAREV
jgi:hypothetical protein